MKISPDFAAIHRSVAACALSGVFLLQGLGPTPPALADGDVRFSRPSLLAPHTAGVSTLTVQFAISTDDDVQVSAYRPDAQKPLHVQVVCDGPGQRGARLPV